MWDMSLLQGRDLNREYTQMGGSLVSVEQNELHFTVTANSGARAAIVNCRYTPAILGFQGV